MHRGGVYTPAAAFGNTNLIENLNSTGKVKFEVLEWWKTYFIEIM